MDDDDVPSQPATLAPPRRRNDTATKIGRYRILELIESDVFRTVYRARDLDRDRVVALHVGRQLPPDTRSRLAQLNHRHCVAVLDIGDHDDKGYVATKPTYGPTLTTWLAETRSPAAILEVFVGAGRGLAAAHAAGVIHGDVSQERIVIGSDGRARVRDFEVTSGDARDDQRAFSVALQAALAEQPITPRLRAVIERGLEAGWPGMTALLDAIERAGRPGRIGTAAIATGLAIASAGALLAYAMWPPPSEPPRPLPPATVVSAPDEPRVFSQSTLVAEPGCEGRPSLSADGTRVYYDAPTGGRNYALFELDRIRNARRRLTPANGIYLMPRISPDGTRVAYVRLQGSSRECHVLSLASGESSNAGPCIGRPAWLDATTLLVGASASNVDRVSLGPTIQRKFAYEVATFGRISTVTPRSAGELVVLQTNDTQHRLALVDPTSTRPIPPRTWTVLPGDVAIGADSTAYHLAVSPSGRTLLRHGLVSGVETPFDTPYPSGDFAISRDRTALVMSTCKKRLQLVRIDRTTGHTVPLFPDRPDEGSPQLLPDGRLVAVSKREGGYFRVVVIDPKTGETTPLWNGFGVHPSLSPDRTHVAWIDPDPADPEPGVYIADLNAGQVTFRLPGAEIREPHLGPDNTTLYVRYVHADGSGIVVRHTDKPMPLVDHVWTFTISTDGTQIALVTQLGEGARLQVGPIEGPYKAIADERLLSLRFSRDGRRLLATRGLELVEIDLAASSTVPLGSRMRVIPFDLDATVQEPAYGATDNELYAAMEIEDGDLIWMDGYFP